MPTSASITNLPLLPVIQSSQILPAQSHLEICTDGRSTRTQKHTLPDDLAYTVSMPDKLSPYEDKLYTDSSYNAPPSLSQSGRHRRCTRISHRVAHPDYFETGLEYAPNCLDSQHPLH